MLVDVVRTGFELANCAPIDEEKAIRVELLRAINLQPQRIATIVEVVIETNENLPVIPVVEDKGIEMVANALETAEKNVCNPKRN